MSVTTPLVSLVGFMHRRWTRLGIFGGIRVLVVHDGTIRLLGEHGRVDLDTTISAVTAKLTLTKAVKLSTRSDFMFVYGFPQVGEISREFTAIAAREAGPSSLPGTWRPTW